MMKNWMKSRWLRVVNNQWGASAVEYALLVSLIAVAIIASVTLLGNRMRGVFSSIANVFR
jgi:pilus assembly protein Flp/PilA